MTRPILLAALLVSACAGKVPETRFYQLAAPQAGSSRAGAGVTLAIEPLETHPAYDDERIVYRVTPYRLDYYNYHRWSATPGTIVADFLERSFDHSGRFRSITRETKSAPVTLGGRVIAIEEVDESKTKWIGRVAIELTLTNTATGTVVWTRRYDESEPLAKQSPEGLAEALTIAMNRIADQALVEIADLAVQVAREAEPAGGKASGPTRAARLRH
jgi:cholesterol transport system auxiliary component